MAQDDLGVITPDEATTGVFRRISVRPPYFDLRDLNVVGDGMVTATVPLGPSTGPEVGAMEAAQISRHLAILGSCAAAMDRDDDQRHHYLATKAHYTRLLNVPDDADRVLRADAIASWTGKRTARALVKLSTIDGKGLNLLDVEYTVMTPKVFSRFNQPLSEEALAVAASATDLAFDVHAVDDGGVRVECGMIPMSMCEGHFPDYPAAPIAIVMGRLGRAAAEAMNRHLGCPNGRFRIEEANVEASKLGRAGQRLVLEAAYRRPVRGGHELTGTALADGEVIGQLTIVMSSHGPAPAVPEAGAVYGATAEQELAGAGQAG